MFLKMKKLATFTQAFIALSTRKLHSYSDSSYKASIIVFDPLFR